jgi:hypothetical protein
MELEEFIKNTLVSLKNGVHAANDALIKQDGGDTRIFALNANSKEGSHVSFDVAVTATHETGKSGSGGIKIAVVGIGGEKSSKEIQESVSHIKFAVSISWVVS